MFSTTERKRGVRKREGKGKKGRKGREGEKGGRGGRGRGISACVT